MNLALVELRRRPGNFATATAILALIATLLLLLGGLLDGLLSGATSAVRGLGADVIVYSSTSENSFPRSRIDADTASSIASLDGVSGVGGLGVTQLGARIPGKGPRDLADVALFGYEVSPGGVPEAPGDGEGYADRRLKASGVKRGDVLRLGPSRSPIKVIGWVEDLEYAGQATLWVNTGTWRSTLNANRPGSRMDAGAVQALVVTAGPGLTPSKLASRIDRVTEGATSSLTTQEAIDAIPGVEEQQSTFGQIIGVTVVIAVIVVGLFFALLTVERVGLYGVLKAIGATSGRLFAGLITQALAVTAIASALAMAAAVIMAAAVPDGAVPFRLDPARAASNIVNLLLAVVIGCAFSLRRVLRVDPASAIGSGT